MTYRDRGYDYILDWVDKVVSASRLFDGLFGPEGVKTGKDAKTRYNELRDSVFNTIEREMMGKITETQKKGMRSFLADNLLPRNPGDTTELDSKSAFEIGTNKYPEWKKIRTAAETEYRWPETLGGVFEPGMELPELPPILQGDAQYIEGRKLAVAEAVKAQPTPIRESARKRVPKEFRPTPKEAGTVESDEYITRRGIKFEISPKVAEGLRQHVGPKEDWTTWDFTARQLTAFGAKKKK